MKKTDKINMLQNAKGTYDICRLYFNYDPEYWYYYVLDVSDKFVLGIEEDDFILDGFQIRKISDIKKIEIKDDICPKINRENKILEGVVKPPIDISSWKSIFETLKPLDKLIIVQNEREDEEYFCLGYVTEIHKSFIIFSFVDAEGEWYDNEQIPYSDITSITFNDRYSRTWQKYVTEHKR